MEEKLHARRVTADAEKPAESTTRNSNRNQNTFRTGSLNPQSCGICNDGTKLETFSKTKGNNMLQDIIMAYKQDYNTPELNPVVAANAYNDMEHSPGEVLHSYKVLTRYLVAQYNDLRSIGYRFTYVSGEPYKTSKAMFVDALHGVLTVRKSLGEDYNDLPDNHPMSVRVDTVDGLMVANDVFRAVHDILGHFAIRATIAPEGELFRLKVLPKIASH